MGEGCRGSGGRAESGKGGSGGKGGGKTTGAKLSRVGKVLKSSGKLLKVAKLRKHRYHPTRSKRERKRLLLLYRKVRLYYRTVPPVLFWTLAILLLLGVTTVIAVVSLETSGVLRKDVGDVGALTGLASLLAAALGVLPELAVTNHAVEAFADAVLAGKGLQGCFHAFKVWGVYWLWILLAVYAVLASATATLTWDVPARVVPLMILAVPLITGIWALSWGLWVVG